MAPPLRAHRHRRPHALEQAWQAAQDDGLTECYSAILVTQAQLCAVAPYPRSPLETAEYQRLLAVVRDVSV